MSLHVRFQGRRQQSRSEAVRHQPLHYRPSRDGNGALGGGQFGAYQHELVAHVLPVGRIAPPLALPFVWAHETADVIRSDVEHAGRAEDERVDLVFGHEGRELRRGDVLDLDLPQHDLVKQPYRVVQVAAGTLESRAILYPDRPRPYVASADLPADLMAGLGTAVPLGALQQLVATDTGDESVDLELQLLETETRPPRANGTVTLGVTPVGAASVWQALADPSDAAYADVTGANERTAFVRVGAPAALGLSIVQWVLTVRAQRESMSGATPWLRGDVSAAAAGTRVVAALGATQDILSTTPSTHTFTSLLHPSGDAWTRGTLAEAHIGVTVKPEAGVRLLELSTAVLTLRPQPSGLVRVDWWRRTIPAVPPESEPPLFSSATLTPFQSANVVPAPGTYYYTARPRDEWGRALVTVGPTAVVVA